MRVISKFSAIGLTKGKSYDVSEVKDGGILYYRAMLDDGTVALRPARGFEIVEDSFEIGEDK